MNWMVISCILCVFGCFKEFRPSESFVTDYLTGPWKNFSQVEVNQEVFPVATYSYAATLVFVFLITDFVRYKPIIILCGLSGAITFLLIIFGQTILSLQIVEFFYGFFLSAEVAYYTYIYAKVDKTHYQEVTGHTKAASLVGRCMAGIVAQITVSFDVLDYHQLNYITLSALVFATIWALFLPSVPQSVYFHRQNVPYSNTIPISSNVTNPKDYETNEVLSNSEQQSPYSILITKPSLTHKIKQAYIFLWKDFLQAYTNSHVIKWSAWWAFSTCGYLQVISYMQLLWQTAVEPGAKIYNGAVDSIYTIIGAATVFCIGKLPLNWFLIGDVVVSFCSFLEGILLLGSSVSENIWVLYAAHIIFGVIYHTMVTVASFEVAKHISLDSYGLIFGINIFFALVLQTILTAVVLNSNFDLDIRSQYFVYGGYFIAIAVVYMITGIVSMIRHYKRGTKFKFWIKNEEQIETPTVNLES